MTGAEATISVAVADDDASVRRAVARALVRRGHRVREFPDGAQSLEALRTTTFDLVITDVEMPELDGLELLRRMREERLATPTLVMSGAGTIARAVEAVQLGAIDFLEKPITPERLYVAVDLALEAHRLREENDAWRRRSSEVDAPMIGSAAAFTKVHELVAKVGPSLARVLITGETGVGKERVARALHEASSRASGPLVTLSCAAMPDALVESELFGHERGAFTGAVERRLGRFELAHRGTLFLDEVGELSPDVQAKLLRVLQEQTFTRVGGARSISVDVRVISATRRDLRASVEEGRFREDLFYRLAVVEIEVPPLRARAADIPALAAHFARQAAEREGRAPPRLSPAVLDALRAYPFPGNVRELRNVMERLVVLSEDEVTVARTRDALGGSTPSPVDDGGTLAERLSRVERAVLVEALAEHGNRAAAARALGVEKSHFYKKCKKHGLIPGRGSM